jgi:enoyl-CoA hydratase/carnithine racemase
MMLDPAPITATRLQQLGLVNKVVGKGMAVNEATKWAEKRSPEKADSPGAFSERATGQTELWTA